MSDTESVVEGAFTKDESNEVRSVLQDERTGTPVRVRWVDSGLGVSAGWTQMEDLPKDVSTCVSVGLWMGENERVVMLGGSQDASNSNWHQVQLIYKPCILALDWLA